MPRPPSLLLCCGLFTACTTTGPAHQGRPEQPAAVATHLELGAFSISLAVKDLAASREFYGKLGFVPVGGDPAQHWQILRNGEAVIGLFQGLFERNTLTFNPGWTQQATELPQFTDVRAIQQRLQQQGLALALSADPASTGPASLLLIDPDGNPVLLDQHVGKPK